MQYKKFSKIELFFAISASIVIFLFYFLFNFNYLTNWIDEKYDANTYKNYVYRYIQDKDSDKNKFIARYNLFNPHHIAFDWLGQLSYRILINKGFTGTLMQALQLRNLFFSSIGLSLLFFLLFKFSKKFLLSLFFILIIAFTSAYWIYSQINDTPIIHSILIANFFMISVYFPFSKNKYLYAFILGIIHSVNIFFHQSDFLFIFVVIYIILFTYDKGFHDESSENDINIIVNKIKSGNLISLNLKNIKFLFIYLSTLIIIIAVAYYYVGLVYIGLTIDPAKAVTINNIIDSNYFFNWIVLYSRIDYWGKGFESNTFQNAVNGISAYFYQKDNINFIHKIDLSRLFEINSILPNMLLIFFFTVFLSLLILFKKLVNEYKHIIIADIIFIVIYFSFACWWEPDYREFWVAPMFSFWILAFLIFNYFLKKREAVSFISGIFIYSYLFLMIFLLFYFNFLLFLYPNSSETFKVFDIINSASSLPHN